MREFFYFVAGIVVTVITAVVALRAQPKKRLCGYVETTTSFDRKWVFSEESMKFLYDGAETERVIHHIFYIWNGGSTVIRLSDLPHGYLAKVRFSEPVKFMESKKIGTAFDAEIRKSEQEYSVVTDHLDRGHAMWCHFVEAVPVGRDPSSVTIEGYVIEGGDIIREARAVPVRRAIRLLRFPALMMGIAAALTLLPFAVTVEPQLKSAVWILMPIVAVIMIAGHARILADLVGGFRYRVPPDFDEVVGRFEAHWTKKEVESRLGIRFPS